MKITISSNEPAPEGAYPFYLTSIVGIGEQTSEYNGEVKINEEAIFGFKSVTEKQKNGQAFTAQKWINLDSTGPRSNLGKVIKCILGAAFSPDELASIVEQQLKPLLGKPLQLNIEHTEKDGNITAKIIAILPPPKNEDIPDYTGDLEFFDMDKPNMEVFNALPDWKKDRINQDLLGTPVEPDDDIPF